MRHGGVRHRVRSEAGGGKTVLYAFQAGNDGAGPTGVAIRDGGGNLYGTTLFGGGSGCGGNGCGTIYRLAPEGTETVLYAFRGGNDGEAPAGSLLIGRTRITTSPFSATMRRLRLPKMCFMENRNFHPKTHWPSRGPRFQPWQAGIPMLFRIAN